MIDALESFVWGAPMLALLLGAHVYWTARTGFIQRKTGLGIRLSLAQSEGEGDVSPLGALSVMLASTIGTGNIVGVGTALCLGGPGALFWCWLTGVLGIATKYAEALIAVKYRVKTGGGRVLGGAMVVLEKRLSMPRAAKAFAVFTVLASLGVGCGVQAGAVAAVLDEGFHIAPAASGVVLCALTGLVLCGGVQGVARVCERLVPAAAALFVACCAALLWLNRAAAGDALRAVLASAFAPSSALGGLAGHSVQAAVRAGVAGGLFSNEAGMGSAPIAAAAARTDDPVRSALVCATGTFWDTVVLYPLTGLALVSAMLAHPERFLSARDGGALCAAAFAALPGGAAALAVCTALLAFFTVLGWSYFGECGARYLFGPRAAGPFRALVCLTALAATLCRLSAVWQLANVCNALMALPNLLAMARLRDEISADTRRFFAGRAGR